MAFMTITPVLPVLFIEWNLSETEAGLLGGAFFIGYVTSVPVLVTLTDRIMPKKIYIFAGIVGASSCFSFAYLAHDLWTGVIFRMLTGLGVAGTYMPALKAIVDSLEEPERSRASSYYTSVYAVGTAVSILSAGYVTEYWGWQYAFFVAGLGICVALFIGIFSLPPGKITKRTESQIADFKRVFRNRRLMVNIASYFGHLWEVFSNRVWIVTFLVFAEAAQPGNFIVSTTWLATLIALVGVPASMYCGELAVRYGREPIIRASMIISVFVGMAVAATTDSPLWVITVMALIYGMISYSDTGTVNTETVSAAEPEVRGATMALHASMGFAGGVLGSLAIGATLQVAGGKDSAEAWTAAFLVMALGSAFGFFVRWRFGKKSENSDETTT
tara:strand:- start:1419 stop:2579 length:1161 start_codon:yes stop_codon:yes gene_type:complete